MNQLERNAVGEALVVLNAYYGREVRREVVSLMLDDLDDCDATGVLSALRDYRRDAKNRQPPLPAQIRAILNPQVDPDSAAREIAARVTAAIPKFGYMRGQDARAYIGEVGWECIERQGGWSFICEHHGLQLDPGVFQAQVRELAKSALIHDRDAMAKMIGLQIAPGNKPGELQSIGEIMKLGSSDKT